MFEFEGTIKEYLTLVNPRTTRNVDEFVFSNKWFDVSPYTFFDVAYNLKRQEISGRAFIDSEREIKPQMKMVAVKLSGLLNREISSLFYSPAVMWEGSPDYGRYIKRTGNRNVDSLSGFIESGHE